MNTIPVIQVVRKGDRYAVRYKSWFGWWYMGHEGHWFTPEWEYDSELKAKQAAKELREIFAKQVAFKIAKNEIL